MRIALLNPWQNAAENQNFQSLRIAASRIGHELLHCTNSDDVEAAAPDFVLAVASTQPKLTRFPTYGVIHEPRDRFLASKEYFHNLLSYDGYLTISDTLEAFLKNVLYGVGRPAKIGFYYNTCQRNVSDPDFPSRLQAGDIKLTYCGTNWDSVYVTKRRARFFKFLSEFGDVEIYGPPQAWQGMHPKAYKGVLDFDGSSVQNKYKQNGVGLVLLSDKHLADDIISNRIFEITSVGAIAISCRIPWLERNFGDSLYYFDQERPDGQIIGQIAEILQEIRANPVDAFNRAQAAQRIFEERFCAEKLLQNAIEYHLAVRGQKQPDGTQRKCVGHPLISVIVRCGGRPLEVVRRAINSIVDQSFGRFHIILVRYKAQDMGPIISEFSHSLESIDVIDCLGGSRSNTLWSGLRHIKGDYFSILDDDDELMPGHFEALFSVPGWQSTNNFFAYTGFIKVCRNPREIMGGALERRFIHSFGISHCNNLFKQPFFFASNCFVASSALLDQGLLIDPQLTTAEDSYLILSLLSKCRARFNFRATAVFHESGDSSNFAADPNRANDVLTVYLRLLSCYQEPPQVIDAHDVLREQNEAVIFPKIYDIEEHEGNIVYHVRDFVLSRVPKGLMVAMPFSLNLQNLGVSGDSRLLDAAQVAMSLRPPRLPWAYAAQFGLIFQAEPDTQYLLEVHCKVTRGTVGFGVLNKNEDDFIYRVAVSASIKPIVVHLPVESAEAVGRFVVQNWDFEGETHVDVSSVSLWSAVSRLLEPSGAGLQRKEMETHINPIPPSEDSPRPEVQRAERKSPSNKLPFIARIDLLGRAGARARRLFDGALRLAFANLKLPRFRRAQVAGDPRRR